MENSAYSVGLGEEVRQLFRTLSEEEDDREKRGQKRSGRSRSVLLEQFSFTERERVTKIEGGGGGENHNTPNLAAL